MTTANYDAMSLDELRRYVLTHREDIIAFQAYVDRSKTAGRMISIEQMLNAAYKLNDWLNFYWNFYVIFVGVIFGWIFNSSSSWSSTQKNVVAVLFIFFAGGNVVTLYRTYRAINQTGRSLKERWGLHSGSLKKRRELDSLKQGQDPFKEALLAKVSQPLWPLAIVMHLITDVIVILSITR